MRVRIPFNEWSMERLSQGRKFATTRSQKYGEPGDTFVVFDRVATQYRLVSVQKMPLFVVRNYLWELEGAHDPEEFEQVWDSIHRQRKYKDLPTLMVWVHFFTRW